MSILISVFLGGGLGAIIRYLVIEQINKLFVVAFPFGTIVEMGGHRLKVG